MRLSGRSEPFDSDEFIYELKIDGFRALARCRELHVRAVRLGAMGVMLKADRLTGSLRPFAKSHNGG